MSDRLGAAFGVGLILYVILCAAIVPLFVLSDIVNRKTCAAEHNVYTCEKFEEWRPVTAVTP